MTRFNWRFAVVVTLVVLTSTAALYASPVYTAYTDPGPNQGTQQYGGNLGLKFNVYGSINVTALGIFNASGLGTITGPIEVGIFNLASPSTPLAYVTFQGQYTRAGYDVFQSITPLLLARGSYEIVAVGFSSADPNGNLNLGSSGPVLSTGGGRLAFAGAGWDVSSTLEVPTQPGCPECVSMPLQSKQFDAGTFQFTPVPEPSMLGLLCMGLLGVGGIRRKLAR